MSAGASPGRWRPRDRNLPNTDVAKEIRASIQEGLQKMETELPEGSLKNAIAKLAAGGLDKSRFPEKGIQDLKRRLRRLLSDHGCLACTEQKGDADQATDVRLVQGLF